MSYVPPHARKAEKSEKSEKKAFKQEFPQLAPPIIDDKPKLDFKKLFKNNERRRQAKARRMKWGTVRLTHNGIIDSLSVEERAAEDHKNEQYRIQMNLDRLGERLERDHFQRLENDPEYDPDEIVTSESESEAESEESESSYAEDPEEDEF
jgi:hypothetical protein